MTRKKSLFLLAAFMFLSSVAAVCSFVFAPARTAMAESSDFVFTTGASIRYGKGESEKLELNDSGLRFTCNIGENTAGVEKNTLKTMNEENYYYAMVILPTDYFGTDKVDGYTREQPSDVIKYILSQSDNSTNTDNSTKFLINYFSQSPSKVGKLQGVITNILEHNYTRFFTAIAFYQIPGGNYVCAVSDSRSPAYVASRALQDIANPHIALTTYTGAATAETDEDGDGYYDITGTPYLTIDGVEYAAPLGVETVYEFGPETDSTELILSFDAVNRRIVVRVTGDLIWRAKTFESNVDVEMQTVVNYGGVLDHNGGMVLKGEGTFFFTGKEISGMDKVNPAFTSYSDVVICNTIAATGTGWTVFSMQDNTTLTIAEGGALTDSCVTGAYGSLVALAANCTVNVKGTLSSEAKSLSSDANDTLIVGASASVTIPTKDNGNQLTFGHIAVQGGTTNINGALAVNDLIVKAGTLNVNITKDGWGVQPAEANECHYYFLGGTTNITRSMDTRGYAGICFTKGYTALAITNTAALNISGFDWAFWRQGSATNYRYEFAQSAIDMTNCNNGYVGDGNYYDGNIDINSIFNAKLFLTEYWNNAVFSGDPITDMNYLYKDQSHNPDGTPLSQSQIDSPVNWDALKMNVA